MTPTAQNPAHQLYDLIKPWQDTPAGIVPVHQREQASGLPYFEATAKAIGLVASVTEYLDERASVNRDRGNNRTHLANIEAGLLGSRQSLHDVVNGSRRWFGDSDMEWLDMVGQSWNRGNLVPPPSAVESMRSAAALVEEHIRQLADLGDDQRQYMLDLCGALNHAVRDVEVFGGANTARLAMELIGALKVYADSNDTRNFAAQMGQAVRDFAIYFALPAAAQITAGGVMLAIAAH